MKTNYHKVIIQSFLENVNKFFVKRGDKFNHFQDFSLVNIDEHLRGDSVLGIIPDVTENLSAFGAIDIDLGKSDLSIVKEATVKIYDLLVFYGFIPVLELSKSGKGTHVWLLFNTCVDKKALKLFLNLIINKAGFKKSINGQVEIFPKGKGNLGVWLPFSGESKIINKDFNESTLKESDIFNIKERNNKSFDIITKLINYPPCVLNACSNWVKGSRDGYTCGIAGVFKNVLKKDLEETKDIIELITNLNKDEEKHSRLHVVDRTYESDTVAGCSILQAKNETITVLDSVCDSSCSFFNKKSNTDGIVDLVEPYFYAKELKKKFHVLCDSRDILWVWDSKTGIWHYNGEYIIENFLELDSEFLPIRRRRTHFINEIINSVKRQSAIMLLNEYDPLNLGNFPKADLKYIPLVNGVYNLDTNKLEEYRPDHYLTMKLPFKYTNDLPKYVDKLVAGFVKEDDLITLYEVMSYCLYRDNPAQLMFLLKGSGANGKSLFMKLMSKLVGENNVSARNMGSLMNNKYSFGSLYNKLINDGGELPITTNINNPELLKAISGEDYLEVEVKYESTLKFYNFAKIFFHGNYLPKTTDTSKGFYRRLMILDFPYSYDKPKDKLKSRDLLEKSFRQSELDALGSLLIRFLVKLRNNKFIFTNHPDWETTKKIYEQESQPLNQFIKEHCVVDHKEDSYIVKYEFKDKLSAWIHRKGTSNPYENDKLLHREMMLLGLSEGRRRLVINNENKQYYAWIGIKWKTDLPEKELKEEDEINEPNIEEVIKSLDGVVPEEKTINIISEREDFMLSNFKNVDSEKGIFFNQSCDIILDWVLQNETIALDLETYSDSGLKKDNVDVNKNKIRVISLSNGKETHCIDCALYTEDEIEAIFISLIPKNIVGHNLKFDLSTIIRKYGKEFLPMNVFDTMLATQILESQYNINYEYSLKAAVGKYLGIELDKSKQKSNWGYDYPANGLPLFEPKLVELDLEQLEYAANDTKHLIPLMKELVKRINENSVKSSKNIHWSGCTDFVTNLEMEFLTNLILIENAGIAIDKDKLLDLKNKLKEKEKDITLKIISDYGIKNPASSKQVLDKLIDMDVKCKVFDYEKNEDIYITISNTSEESLVNTDHPLAKMVLELRETSKTIQMIDTYLDKILEDGRVHPEFTQILDTGRMAARNPNTQQIPKSIKEIFYKEEEGKTVIKVDYPAIELRILAAYLKANYNDNTMIKLFFDKEGVDPHIATAALVFQVKESEIDKKDWRRQVAKGINFGFSYGMGIQRFRNMVKENGLDLTIDQAKQYKELFKSKFKKLDQWHKETADKIKTEGSMRVVSLGGRILNPNTYNSALNFPIQSTGGDILKYAIVIFYKLLEGFSDLKRETNIVNIVHDEIVVETSKEFSEKVYELLCRAMEISVNYILKYFKTVVK